MFVQEKRATLTGCATEVARELSKLWSEMIPKDRKVLENQGKAMKEQYEKEYKAYRASMWHENLFMSTSDPIPDQVAYTDPKRFATHAKYDARVSELESFRDRIPATADRDRLSRKQMRSSVVMASIDSER